MKKTKLMHTLLALALSYGTFSSQAMAAEYDRDDFLHDYTWSDKPPTIDKNGKPVGYTEIPFDKTIFSSKPELRKVLWEYIGIEKGQLKFYSNDQEDTLVHNVDTNSWRSVKPDTDKVNQTKAYKRDLQAQEETTTEDTTTDPTMTSVAANKGSSDNESTNFTPPLTKTFI